MWNSNYIECKQTHLARADVFVLIIATKWPKPKCILHQTPDILQTPHDGCDPYIVRWLIVSEIIESQCENQTEMEKHKSSYAHEHTDLISGQLKHDANGCSAMHKRVRLRVHVEWKWYAIDVENYAKTAVIRSELLGHSTHYRFGANNK